MSFFSDAAFSAGAMCYLGVVDIFNLVSRPVVLHNWLTNADDPFVGHGLLSAMILTLSVMVVMAGLFALTHCSCCKGVDAFFQLMILFTPWTLDLLLQLPDLLWAKESQEAAWYPVGHTGVIAVLEFGIACGLFMGFAGPSARRGFEDVAFRGTGLLFAVSLRFVANTFTRSWFVSTFVFCLAIAAALQSLFVGTVPGRMMAEATSKVFRTVAPIVAGIATHVRTL